MAKIVKVVKAIRNNWKKSVVASVALYYGANYAVESFKCRRMMRQYCEEAKKYGEYPIPVDAKPRHITVILNPAANKRKAKRDFEDFCAPLLHLAGLSVNVLVTEEEGQARTLTEKLQESTDAIVIAGGDGTLSEAVTGLLRRPDGSSVTRKIPLGVLPVGRSNAVAKHLFPDSCNERAKLLAEATMAIIKEATRPLDVIKFQVLPTPNYDPGKPVFSLIGLEWGAFRDANAKREKYWYFGALRGYASYVFSALKDENSGMTWNCDADVEYSAPCKGCSRCYPERLDLQPEPVPRRSWWGVFGTRQQHPPKKTVDYSQVINEQCGKVHHLVVKTVDFSILSSNVDQQSSEPDAPHLRLYYGLKDLTFSDFVTEGWARERGDRPSRPEAVKARTIKVWPASSPVKDESTSDLDPSGVKPQEPEKWLSIDSEDYEVKAVNATVLPNMIKMFCPPNQQTRI